MNLKPDVEAIFVFLNGRKVCDGFRPAHLVKENYLTTGLHHYYNLGNSKEEKLIGTITFISPDKYPACLWVGKKIKIFNGAKLIGYATITQIFNTILQRVDE